MYGHTTALDDLVKTRQERVDSTRTMVARNLIAKSVLSQVEGELSDAEQRRQDAINQYGMARQRLASLAADGLRVQADAHQGVVARPGRCELLDEFHATRLAARFFRYTSSMESAAGVTPGMRPAWPSVAGQDSLRRCRTSVDRPGTRP